MSEAGVELQNGEGETVLAEPAGTAEVGVEEKRELQKQAAEEFLSLPNGLSYPIDRMYYYQYTAPTKSEQATHAFDSALLEVENGHFRERPAYCVLAYTSHICPPTVETESEQVAAGFQVCQPPSSVVLNGRIDANGAKVVSYHFEYGSTNAYGTPTETQTMQVKGPWISAEVHATIPVSGCGEIHFRLVASNAQAPSGASSEHTISFVYACRCLVSRALSSYDRPRRRNFGRRA